MCYFYYWLLRYYRYYLIGLNYLIYSFIFKNYYMLLRYYRYYLIGLNYLIYSLFFKNYYMLFLLMIITVLPLLSHGFKLFNSNLFLYNKYYNKWILLQLTIKAQSSRNIM